MSVFKREYQIIPTSKFKRKLHKLNALENEFCTLEVKSVHRNTHDEDRSKIISEAEPIL